ncbi:MAG: dienelactone hydrolase family protein [Calothrix sp. C42_A2020_038]|nr:dienelactone hydrolase family protein [Calothrix sp. C42_A2020_038]
MTSHKYNVYVYEGANHAFANLLGKNYNPEAAEDAWDKTITFLKQHLI